jgi:broad specificity phosphatase PhoE
MSKVLYCIRHGLAEHNVNYVKYGLQTFYDPRFTDTSLVEPGFEQARKLRHEWNQLHDVELVIVSPLKRALQTASEIFKDNQVPIVALECVREFPMGKQTCNKRSSKQLYESKYPHITFDDLLTNHDELWLSHREETRDELQARIDVFKNFIMKRPETTIALVNHGGFIGQLKDKTIKYIENGDTELLHCYPYPVKL